MVKTINILIADDDKDDILLFNEALSELPLITSLTTVSDGEKLMQYLSGNTSNLPDMLFLDVNMPRKNGFECLIEIKKQSAFNNLAVVIYSTSFEEDKVTQFYENGAHYYIC